MKKDMCFRIFLMFDIVVAKVDAPDEALFQRINRPVVSDTLEDILWGIQRFREAFEGKLALQMMFLPANQHRATEMAQIARRLGLHRNMVNFINTGRCRPDLQPRIRAAREALRDEIGRKLGGVALRAVVVLGEMIANVRRTPPSQQRGTLQFSGFIHGHS